MPKKILMACASYWTSSVRVGSHHLARQFVKRGYEVAFVSDPISPLHTFLASATDLRERAGVYLSGGQRLLQGRLWNYVGGALLTPANQSILRARWLSRHWHLLSIPNVVSKVMRQGFTDVDLLYVDSVKQGFWLGAIRPERVIFRLADYNPGFSNYTPTLDGCERDLVQNADLVLYTANSLKAYVESMRPRQMLHFPNGVDYAHLNAARPRPPEYGAIARPIVVYVGSIDVWFDSQLVIAAARRLPEVSFVLIGPPRHVHPELKRIKNIILLGPRDHALLPGYLQHADVGMIPFDRRNYPHLVDRINPLKLYEYLACGLPVVAVEWRELKWLQSPAMLCQNCDEFVQAIAEKVVEPGDRRVYVNFAARHDWSRRVDDLFDHLSLS